MANPVEVVVFIYDGCIMLCLACCYETFMKMHGAKFAWKVALLGDNDYGKPCNAKHLWRCMVQIFYVLFFCFGKKWQINLFLAFFLCLYLSNLYLNQANSYPFFFGQLTGKWCIYFFFLFSCSWQVIYTKRSRAITVCLTEWSLSLSISFSVRACMGTMNYYIRYDSLNKNVLILQGNDMDASRGILSGTVDRFKTVNFRFKTRTILRITITVCTSKYPIQSSGMDTHASRIGVNWPLVPFFKQKCHWNSKLDPWTSNFF